MNTKRTENVKGTFVGLHGRKIPAMYDDPMNLLEAVQNGEAIPYSLHELADLLEDGLASHAKENAKNATGIPSNTGELYDMAIRRAMTDGNTKLALSLMEDKGRPSKARNVDGQMVPGRQYDPSSLVPYAMGDEDATLSTPE